MPRTTEIHVAVVVDAIVPKADYDALNLAVSVYGDNGDETPIRKAIRMLANFEADRKEQQHLQAVVNDIFPHANAYDAVRTSRQFLQGVNNAAPGSTFPVPEDFGELSRALAGEMHLAGESDVHLAARLLRMVWPLQTQQDAATLLAWVKGTYGGRYPQHVTERDWTWALQMLQSQESRQSNLSDWGAEAPENSIGRAAENDLNRLREYLSSRGENDPMLLENPVTAMIDRDRINRECIKVLAKEGQYAHATCCCTTPPKITCPQEPS